MADIFISYASEDRDRVRPLAEALIRRGFNVWWDRALAAGQDYAAIIERELNNAKAVIVVWTQGAVASTFVRDEAGRARDDGRLVPIMLDRVNLPLGFGAFQAEDFSAWNGGANAPQLQLLEEVLRAKLTGRDVDGAAIERRRRRLGARVRLVSLLTVAALIVVIAVGAKNFFAPPEPDIRAQLLQLLAEGRLTPEQAIQLAELLETDSLGAAPMLADASPAPAASADGASTRSMEAEPGAVQPASVTEAEFDAAARETYREAFLALARHPEPRVRLAVAQLAQDGTREAAMTTLWDYAQSHPDDPMRDEIYLLCGSVGERNSSPLGRRALEAATSLTPENTAVWEMLSRSYSRASRTEEAAATALVAEAVQAEEGGDTAGAEQRLQMALPNLSTPVLRAPVESRLGQIAESRGDYDVAASRFAQAYALREQTAVQGEPAQQVLVADAQFLVRALDRSGRTREACETLQQAQQEHDVAVPDQDLLQRCQNMRVQLRPRVELAPQLREGAVVRQYQRAPAIRTAPAEQQVAPVQQQPAQTTP